MSDFKDLGILCLLYAAESTKGSSLTGVPQRKKYLNANMKSLFFASYWLIFPGKYISLAQMYFLLLFIQFGWLMFKTKCVLFQK